MVLLLFNSEIMLLYVQHTNEVRNEIEFVLSRKPKLKRSYFRFWLRITSCSGCVLLPVPVVHDFLFLLTSGSGCAILPVPEYFLFRLRMTSCSGCALLPVHLHITSGSGCP